MFAIGDSKGRVNSLKLELPKEYCLRKKDRKIYGVWVGEKLLYLSDEVKALKAKAGKEGNIIEFRVNVSSKINIPSYLDQAEAVIKGCISTIEIKFNNEEE